MSRIQTARAFEVEATAAPQDEAQLPLRVAIFSGNYNYVMDGPARALNLLVAHLEKRGHQALVFAPTSTSPAFAHEGELVPIPSLRLPEPRSEFRLGLGLPAAARRRLDAFQPSIIHVASPDWLGFGALSYGRRRGVPVVASFHTRFDTYPRYYGAPWLERYVTDYLRWFYRRCVHVYPPSQSMVDALRADGIGADLRIWARGVDPALFNPDKRDMALRRAQGLDDDTIVVAYVGRIVREKGIDAFADAVVAATKANPKIRALIVGDGPDRSRFEARTPGGRFLGFQQGEALARAYASADIFLNPSVTETFGQVTLEAMASGLPSVCAAASGSLSLVEEGISGLLSPPAEGAGGYAARLLTLAADAAMRGRFGRAARAKAERFSWPAILDGLVANYRDAIAHG